MFIKNQKNPILLIEEHNLHLQVIGEQCAPHPPIFPKIITLATSYYTLK